MSDPSGFHDFTDTPCGRALAACERDLKRPLGWGEMADFLLDKFTEIADSAGAHQIRDSVIIAFGRTTLGRYEGKILSAKVPA